MANINTPIQPTNDPNYLRRTQSIDVPRDIKPEGVAPLNILPQGVTVADRSPELRGKAAAAGMQAEAQGIQGFGDMFNTIAGIGDFLGKAGDSLVKKSIENQVYDTVKTAQQAQMNALEDLKNNPQALNLISKSQTADESMPSDLENLPNNLGSLQGAKDSGKISNTYYYSRLVAEAKDLRAKYPGYKDYIDQQFSKVSGVNPANAYIQGLIGDINRMSNATAGAKNKVDKFIESNIGLPNSEKIKALWDNGQINQLQVFQWAAPYHQQETKLRTQGLAIQNIEAGDKYNVKQSQLHGSDIAATTVSNFIDKIASVGTPAGMDKPSNIMDLITRAENGQIPQEQIQAFGQQLVQSREQLRMDLVRKFDTPGVDGVSLTRRVGGIEDRNKIINASLGQLDNFIDSMGKGQFAIAQASANAIKSRTDDNALKLMNNPKFGNYFQQLPVLKQLGGDSFTQEFFKDLIRNDVPKQYQEYVKGMQMEQMTQTQRTKNGSPLTYNDIFSDMKDKGIDDPRVTRNVLSTIDRVTDPKTPDPVKLGIISSAFDPNNRGMIAKLNRDAVDSRGRPVKGQYGVFADFTSPAMTKEIMRLSAKDPSIADNYKNWTESTFSQLFGQSVRNLNQSETLLTSRPDTLKLNWDPVNKRFDLYYKNTGDTSDARQVAFLQRNINQINSGLYSMKNVAKMMGNEDIESYLIQTLRNVGGKPNEMGVSGIPITMMEAINKASGKDASFKDRWHLRNDD